MSSEAAISVRSLGKCYQIYPEPKDRLLQMLTLGHRRFYHEFWALRDVSFEVGKGECVGVVGRNGSGKSTLLQMICGVVQPTAGNVVTVGRVAALLELGSGFNPDFTGRENVHVSGAIMGLDRKELEERFGEIVSFAEIGDFVDRPVKTYSSGMLMRLAFAVQVILDPDVLIVDEALAVGDEKFQRKCFARIESLKAAGTSILFVSHSAPQIIELCDRAILLDRGDRLLFQDAARVVRAYQKLIYAPASEQEALRRHYLEEGDTTIVAQGGQNEAAMPASADGQGEYDPALVQQAAVQYTPQGAQIESIRLLDSAGRDVNLLHAGQAYRVVLLANFSADCEDVHFGVNIHTLSGLVVTGQRHPAEVSAIPLLRVGERRRVIFAFRMVMVPGVYVVGGGIWSRGAPYCRHRIVDALMFRILPAPGAISFGIVDVAAADPLMEAVP